jgi:hypothetical protein
MLNKKIFFITILVLFTVGIVYFFFGFLKIDSPITEETEEKKEEALEEAQPDHTFDVPYLKETEKHKGVKSIDLEGKNYNIEYKIMGGSAFDRNGDKMVVYNIISGNLNKEQVNLLASSIIEDIISQDDRINEITLLFFRDEDSSVVDVAQVVWELGEISVFMRNI